MFFLHENHKQAGLVKESCFQVFLNVNIFLYAKYMTLKNLTK
jgi:hypothetical protein